MDKNDFIRISPTNSMTVTSRQDSAKQEYDQKKKKQEKKEKEIFNKVDVDNLEIIELLEFGRLILNKRNTELKLFMKLRQESGVESLKSDEDEIASPSTHHADSRSEQETAHRNDKDTLLLQVKIAEYDKELQEIALKSKAAVNGEVEFDVEREIMNLQKLCELYCIFFECVKEENRVLNIDDIDFLDDIIKQKEDVLTQITDVRNDINFDSFKNISPEDENKIKANEILSDIHNVIDKIIRQEDENSVELQNIREKMKLDIAKQDKGAKVISQYSQSTTKSHFIDTKK